MAIKEVVVGKAKKLTFEVHAYMKATGYDNTVIFYTDELKTITLTQNTTFRIRKINHDDTYTDTSYNAGTHTIDVAGYKNVQMYYSSIAQYQSAIFSVVDYE